MLRQGVAEPGHIPQKARVYVEFTQDYTGILTTYRIRLLVAKDTIIQLTRSQ